MKNISLKQNLPLAFLVFISVTWGIYYQSNSAINNYGQANYEWLFLLDGLLVLPLLCFYCSKDKKQAGIKALIMAMLAILVGSYIIPESNKYIWSYLESGRYLILAAVLFFEVTAVAAVCLAIKTSLHKGVDPDEATTTPITRFLGTGTLAQIMMFEARVWTFALFSKGISNKQFNGSPHFSYHNKDGAQSNLLGFVVIITFELPIMHVLLHYIWSPTAANIISLLTLFGLLFFWAEYRAVSRRPISLTTDQLIIRFGLYPSVIIPLSDVADITKTSGYIPRAKNIKRYNYAGNPNLVITLKLPLNGIEKIYLGVDQPDLLLTEINNTTD